MAGQSKIKKKQYLGERIVARRKSKCFDIEISSVGRVNHAATAAALTSESNCLPVIADRFLLLFGILVCVRAWIEWNYMQGGFRSGIFEICLCTLKFFLFLSFFLSKDGRPAHSRCYGWPKINIVFYCLPMVVSSLLTNEMLQRAPTMPSNQFLCPFSLRLNGIRAVTTLKKSIVFACHGN